MRQRKLSRTCDDLMVTSRERETQERFSRLLLFAEHLESRRLDPGDRLMLEGEAGKFFAPPTGMMP